MGFETLISGTNICNVTYFLTSASKALDDWPSEFERERRLWGIRAGDRIAGSIWSSHCVRRLRSVRFEQRNWSLKVCDLKE